jgi:UDP-N-acetylglucosamine--N-acetylmuramyl-(pentapeptide) pyrophosphoryl-undecaprenol N-acetylglucosamine transferase
VRQGRSAQPLVLLAAGGTGGHLFPAEALAHALQRRGAVVDLATDERATRYGTVFPGRATHIVPSATMRAAAPLEIVRTIWRLGYGTGQAYRLLAALRPSVVVGFGGYPTIPPVLAAGLRRVPTVIHEQNGVMGRANRVLAPLCTAIATGFPNVLEGSTLARKATHTGNPVRPAVAVAAATPYHNTDETDALKLLVFGGSQGARVMAEIVPAAIEHLDRSLRARLAVVQQTRAEDLERVRAAYRRAGIVADVASFFPDLPARMAAAQLVISRSGASTVAELSAIGRPAILVPLPHALDQDQLANARLLERAGGAVLVPQPEFTPERLARDLAALSAAPKQLAGMAAGARSIGILDGAERLADLVVRVAGVEAAS